MARAPRTLDEIMAERTEKRLREIMAEHPQLSPDARAERLAQLIASKDEKVAIQALRLAAQINADLAPTELTVNQRVPAESLADLDEALRGLPEDRLMAAFEATQRGRRDDA